MTDPARAAARFTCDPNGNPILAVTDAKGQTTTHLFHQGVTISAEYGPT